MIAQKKFVIPIFIDFISKLLWTELISKLQDELSVCPSIYSAAMEQRCILTRIHPIAMYSCITDIMNRNIW